MNEQSPNSEWPEYKRIRKIAKGSRGKVYEVEKDGERFALKDISKKSFDDSSIVALREGLKIQKSLQHPNILQVLEIFETQDSLFAIMPLCQNDLLKFRKTLEKKEIPNIFRQIVNVVLFLEDMNLIHGDIKLQNIVMHNGIPKLTDFDTIESYVCDKEGKYKTTRYIGYTYYMAPEMCHDGYTAKVNSWQLGMILYGLWVDDDIPVNIFKNFQQNRYETSRERYEYVAQNAPSIPEKLKEEPETYDLLVKLLQPNPNLRPSVSEILEHPYLV